MRLSETSRAERRLVLVGGGHAHVGVLRSLAMQREPGLEVVLIAKELDAPYSGMLPGYVAGHYDYDACNIDLVRLAHYADARLIHGEVVGVDPKRREVEISGRPPLAYDLLSIDTGITPAIDDIVGATEHALAVKPVSSFAPRWKALEARALAPSGPRRILVIGTGAAGFEIVLAIRHRLRDEAPRHGISPDAFSFVLVGSAGLLPTHNARAQALAAAELARAGIELVTGDAAIAVAHGQVRLASGRLIASDATLVTTKAAPPAWFRETGLALDPAGFLAVRPTLQVIGEDDVFAVGDCANVLDHPREKAGVFAVRQGPPLTRNLRLRARGMAAEPFEPQRHFLTLLSSGGKSAIAARGRFATAGCWAWRLKDRIDRDFMRRFQDLPAPSADMTSGAEAMLCAGCAAKLGPAPLSRALHRFAATAPAAAAAAPRVVNLAPNDDAAVLDLGGDTLRLESIDHFPAIWPEPYVLGEIAAAHALGDILAKGGTPDHALAVASLPLAASHLQEDDLFQLLAGARAVFQPEGVELVGGHTARGEEASIGFFVSGTVPRDRLLRKGGLRGGEVLLLTKPLGTGVLFAAWMRRMARASEVATAISGMRRSNAAAARIVLAHGAIAATDVTGFGLAGHLVEMLEASAAEATIGLAACPRYPGVDRLLAAGIRSSLLPENMALGGRLAVDIDDAEAALALLFDPQTSGGLLAGVPPAAAAPCLAALTAAGIEAAVIGTVSPERRSSGRPLLKVQHDLASGDVLSGALSRELAGRAQDSMKTT
jgi:selenide,water dikinase